MMPILLRGNNAYHEHGFVLLKTMIYLLAIILFFSAVLGGVAVLSHQSGVILHKVETEINNRNEAEMGRAKL